MSDLRYFLHLPDEDATQALGEALGSLLMPGDTILLEGALGTGKTHFARSVIQFRLAAAGRQEDVPSPTFTLVQTYDDGVCEIWHADLYRLTVPDELPELGLQDAFETAICLVEWPDRLAGLAPRDPLTITFRHRLAGEGRDAEISGDERRWAHINPVLQALTREFPVG